MTSMTSKTVEPRTGHENFVRECAACAIQAVVRGHVTRRWYTNSWGDSDDDEEDRITTADLLRLTAGSARRAAGAYYGRHPNIVYDRGNPFRALSQSCISSPGIWVNPDCGGAPRRVTECPCCDSSDIIVRGFSGGGVGVDENVYCGSCGEYLGVEL